MLLAVLLVAVSLLIILIAAELFTNAIEWFGHRLGLAAGPVGSVLAAVGTALPETMIPIIAILVVGSEDANEIGIGAILGAPFLLSTAAFAVTGLGVIAFAKRRVSGRELRIDAAIFRRDIGYFFVVYLFAISASFIPWELGKHLIAFVLLGLYGLYLYKTFSAEGDPSVEAEDELARLRFSSLVGKAGSPATALIISQLVVSLAMIIGAAQLFVTNLEHVSHELGIPALALALIIAPLATELPEKFNSIIWVRQGKDTLALGNISGAMVFQSCIPVAVGLFFTEWELTETALVSSGIALLSTGIVYTSLHAGYLSAMVLARAGLLWVAFVSYVVIKLSV